MKGDREEQDRYRDIGTEKFYVNKGLVCMVRGVVTRKPY